MRDVWKGGSLGNWHFGMAIMSGGKIEEEAVFLCLFVFVLKNSVLLFSASLSIWETCLSCFCIQRQRCRY